MIEPTEILAESRVEHVPGQLAFNDLLPKRSEQLRDLWQKSRGFMGKIALVGTLGFGAGAIVVPTVHPPEIDVGPHSATVQANLSGQMVLDMGPADTLKRSSGEIYGATLVIKGLRGDNSEQESTIGESIEAYANLFDPKKISSDAIGAIKNRATEGGVSGSIILMAGFGALYASYGERRRKELSDSWRKRQRQLVPIGLAGILAVGSGAGLIWAGSGAETARASSELDGTPLEGWTAHSSLLRSGIAEFVNVLQRNENTANEFRKNLKEASETTPILEANKGSFTVVVAGNIKCNMVLPPSIGEIVRDSRATYFILAGDPTFSGSSLENPCVSSLAFHTKDAERIVSPGNHSSNNTEKVAKEEGFTSLNRKIVSIAGRTFVGDDSPRRSAFAQGTIAERKETETEMGQTIANEACKQKVPLFAVVFNEPNAARSSAEKGCATLVIAASEESSLAEITSLDGKKSWYFLAGNATGTTPGSINLGEPNDVSEITVLKLDSQTNNVIAEQTISFYPTGRVVDIPEPQLFSVS